LKRKKQGSQIVREIGRHFVKEQTVAHVHIQPMKKRVAKAVINLRVVMTNLKLEGNGSEEEDDAATIELTLKH